MKKGQVLFTYLHLAPDPEQTKSLIAADVVGIAYETVTGPNNTLPLLSPMSEVAGRMAVQAGAHCLEREAGGAGILLGGVPGVKAANVVVIGGGVVGTNAIRVAMGMEAQVTVIDRSLPRLKELDFQFGGRLNTIYSTVRRPSRNTWRMPISSSAPCWCRAPRRRGWSRAPCSRRCAPAPCWWTSPSTRAAASRPAAPTTHSNPTYVEERVVHYCVANMPGAVPRTSTFALNNATLPYTLALADKGYRKALLEDPGLLAGLNVHRGALTFEAVAKALGQAYTPASKALA